MQIQSLWGWSQDRKRLVKHFNSFTFYYFLKSNSFGVEWGKIIYQKSGQCRNN